MSLTPAWVLCIPESSDPNYFRWLVTKAAGAGVPDHVIMDLVKQYFSIPEPTGLSLISGRIELYYEVDYDAQKAYDRIEDIIHPLRDN